MLNKLHSVDIIIIALYLILCLVIGFISSKKIRNIKEYAIGGKYTPTFILIGTFLATDIGAGMTVGSVERVYSLGLIFAATMMLRPLCWLIALRIFSDRIEYFKSKGCLSVSDIMEVLYGKTARNLTNLMALALSIGTLVMQITAMGYLFAYFLGFSPTTTALVAFAVLVTYSFFGGIRAVALTDVIQASIFFIGIPLACYLAYLDIGLTSQEIWSQLPLSHTTIKLDNENFLLFSNLIFYFLVVGAATEGPFMQRYLMCYNGKQMREVLKSCFYISMLFTLIIGFIGYLVKIKAPEINPNTALFYLVDNYLPIGIKGLLVAGLLATIMSTADSWLNTASILFAHDILKKISPSINSKTELLSARIFLLCISGFATILVLVQNSTLRELSWMVGNFWTPMIFIPVIAGFMGFCTNSRSFIGSSICAASGVIIGYILTGELSMTSTTLGTLGSIVGLFSTHRFQLYKGILKSNKTQTHTKVGYASILRALTFNRLLKISQNSVHTHGRFYYLAGSLGLVFFVGSLFFNGIHHTSIVIGLNMVSAVLCLTLCMHEYLFSNLQRERYMPLFFHFSLFVIFALNSGYKLVLSNFETLWLLNFVLSILVIYFVAGFKTCLVLSTLSIVLSFALLETFNEIYMAQYTPNIWYFIMLISSMIFAAKNKEFFLRNAIDHREYYAQMMAHQVLQPIATTSTLAHHLNDILSEYKEEQVNESGEAFYAVKKDDFLELKNTITDFKNTSKANEQTVRGLLTMSKDDIENAPDIATYDIYSCVEDALSIYDVNKRARITVSKNGTFEFKGSKMLIVEVIRNIVSNCFMHAGKGAKISISFKDDKLHIKDDGLGIDQDVLETLFEETNKKHGSGLGLVFSKRVMDTFNGTITCNSKKGKYTEFVLGFINN